ncbi:CAP domain-containing protein [Lentiprolixibacter aurantiacus]|uniref:CAP domain-containing protein n=1 Tax=Lentiprolixibacter aurantiacus TaxID=2993939 RepID=A0AAE3MJ28_9FLAO|nr:CAP domain-containing protein [Lentiprolixibacter aurantiacus]MCX2718354.1 CAP domain-containing protein [Lentiprolixibacter aurantiacus]
MKLNGLLLAFLLCIVVSCNEESQEETLYEINQNAVQVENALLQAVNEHRISLGFNALEFSAIAYEYANEHNDYMIAKGGLSHDHFSSRASSIAAETNAEYVSENVAKDYPSAQQAFEGWLNSPNHRKTMEGEFTHTAVSVKVDNTGNYYYTQLFYR